MLWWVNRSRASMKLIRSLAILALLVAATPATGGKAKVFPAKGVDMSQYHTYQWAKIRLATKTGIVEEDDRVAPMIKESMNRQLAARSKLSYRPPSVPHSR